MVLLMLFNYQPSLGLGTPNPGVCIDLCGTIMFSDIWLRTPGFLKMQRQFWGLSIQEKQAEVAARSTQLTSNTKYKEQLCSARQSTAQQQRCGHRVRYLQLLVVILVCTLCHLFRL